ncbi:tetratricopeptide repeat protein [Tautonia marina]|uniref:tetratricopeptide repeat protein n=1 Tax=Tautonia marina TaxID=2653855 RepID=UPI0012606741|nr:tetratricopeptide repeat protein [Tautonia marina]
MSHPPRMLLASRGRSSTQAVGLSLLGLLVLLLAGPGCSGDDTLGQQVAAAIASGQLDEAQQIVDRWLSRRSNDPDALAWAARVALARDRPTEAFEFARRAQQQGLDRSALRDVEGVALARAGRMAEAEPLLRAHLAATDRPDPVASQALAEIGLATFRFGAAREALARWRRDAPDDPEPWLMEAEISERIGDEYTVIASHYREALKRDPSLDGVLLRLAETIRRSGNYREAVESFNAYLDRHPDDPDALAWAGLNQLGMGEVEAAERLLRQALAREPDHLEAIKGLARLYQQTGRVEESLAQFNRAAELDPEQADIPYQQSLLLARLGRREEAEQMRERSEQLRAQAAEIERLRDALVRDPGNAELQYETARWLIEHGHAEEGVRWAEKAITTVPGHRPSCLLLAEYYEATDQPDLANFYRFKAAPADR